MNQVIGWSCVVIAILLFTGMAFLPLITEWYERKKKEWDEEMRDDLPYGF